jgi:Zn-dependent protease with chaperone function
MIKELKYLFFILITFLFLFFTLKYYFSDINKKRSYRSISNVSNNFETYKKDLPILKNDTINIIEFIENNQNSNKKTFNFWELLNENKK